MVTLKGSIKMMLKTEADVYSRELSRIQKRIENLEYKKDYSKSSYELENLLVEIRCLKEIEEFLWNKL